MLTLNLHKGFGPLGRRFILHELRAAVREVGAELVFLQEVLGAHARLSRRHPGVWPDAPQYEFLADSIWPAFAYGRNAVYPDGHHGNALLSRYPIHGFDNIALPTLRRGEARGLLHCRLGPPELPRTLHALCVHLGLRDEERSLQLEALARTLDAIPPDAALVVAGDFNDWRLRGHARLCQRAGLTEVYATAAGKPARTFPARLPLLRLDRVYSRGLHRTRALPLPTAPFNALSDHAPLAAEVLL